MKPIRNTCGWIAEKARRLENPEAKTAAAALARKRRLPILSRMSLPRRQWKSPPCVIDGVTVNNPITRQSAGQHNSKRRHARQGVRSLHRVIDRLPAGIAEAAIAVAPNDNPTHPVLVRESIMPELLIRPDEYPVPAYCRRFPSIVFPLIENSREKCAGHRDSFRHVQRTSDWK